MTTDSLCSIYIAFSIFDTVYNASSYFALKYDSAGILVWTTSYCVNPMLGAGSRGITVDNSGNVFVTGGAGVVSSFNQTDMTTINYSQPTGIKVISAIVPKSFMLYQNYPNPFNPVTKIEYAIPKKVCVSLKVYDMLGREVQMLVNEFKNAGYHTVIFDGSKLSSGVYIYKLQAGQYSDTKKMIILK